MGIRPKIKLALALICFFLVSWPGYSRAILKNLTQTQIKAAIDFGNQYQLSPIFVDRAYQIDPSEQQTRVLIASKYYQLAKAAAQAGYERRSLEKEAIDKILKSDQLEIRFQINYGGSSGLFDFFRFQSAEKVQLEFKLKQGRKVVEPSRVMPPWQSFLLGPRGTYKVYFPYAKINFLATTELIIATPEGNKEAIRVKFSRFK
jgi:hypothetical protein